VQPSDSPGGEQRDLGSHHIVLLRVEVKQHSAAHCPVVEEELEGRGKLQHVDLAVPDFVTETRMILRPVMSFTEWDRLREWPQACA